MDIKKLINSYNVKNEQETKDKEVILKYINLFNDILYRKNEIAHFVSSAIIFNKEKTKILMVHHNIFNTWAWVGGHADGVADLLSVAIKEVKEETGLKSIEIISNEIVSLDVTATVGHFKNKKYVPAHTHLSVAYIFEADEKDKLKIKTDENSDVKWIEIEKIDEINIEEQMKKIYKKIVLFIINEKN